MSSNSNDDDDTRFTSGCLPRADSDTIDSMDPGDDTSDRCKDDPSLLTASSTSAGSGADVCVNFERASSTCTGMSSITCRHPEDLVGAQLYPNAYALLQAETTSPQLLETAKEVDDQEVVDEKAHAKCILALTRRFSSKISSADSEVEPEDDDATHPTVSSTADPGCSEAFQETDPSKRDGTDLTSSKLQVSSGGESMNVFFQKVIARKEEKTEDVVPQEGEEEGGASSPIEPSMVDSSTTARPPRSTQPSESRPGAFLVLPQGGYADHNATVDDIESLEEGQPHQTSSGAGSNTDDGLLLNATLVDKDDQILVQAEPALKGFRAIVANERFKCLAAFVVLVLIAIAVTVALLVTRRGKKNEVVSVIEVVNLTPYGCGTHLLKQADYRGNISVTETGKACQVRRPFPFPIHAHMDRIVTIHALLQDTACPFHS